MEPNGPNESRSATIRAASTGPIQGRASISAWLARSRSVGRESAGPGREPRLGAGGTGRSGGSGGGCCTRAFEPDGLRLVGAVLRGPAEERPARPACDPPAAPPVFRAPRTLSTAAICAVSSARSTPVGCGSADRARTTRTDTPRSRRALRKRRALRSDGVTAGGRGWTYPTRGRSGGRNRKGAGRGRKTGIGNRETGNGERGTEREAGNGKRETGNGERSGKRETGNGKRENREYRVGFDPLHPVGSGAQLVAALSLSLPLSSPCHRLHLQETSAPREGHAPTPCPTVPHDSPGDRRSRRHDRRMLR